MDKKQLILDFWRDVAKQNAPALRQYFSPEATVYWHNTNEKFSVEEYIRANCEYPGSWNGEVERIEFLKDLVITVTRVWLQDNSASFHATSFFEFETDKIIALNEYWGDDGTAPQWRLEKKIGQPISKPIYMTDRS